MNPTKLINLFNRQNYSTRMAQPQLVRNSAILQTGEICSFMVKKSRVVYRL